MAGASPATTMIRPGKVVHAYHGSGTPCGCHARLYYQCCSPKESFKKIWKGVAMFLVEFLKEAVPAGDKVTRWFIDCMVPEMMNRYVIRSAKGGSHAGDTHYSEETRRKFEANADQSMLSHLLNGIFPSLR